MRIVLVLDQYDNQNNGTTVTAQRYAAALRKLGHEVRIVSTGSPTPDKYLVKNKYIPIVSRVASWQGMVFGQPDDQVFIEAFQGADIVHFFLPFSLCRRGEEIARQMKIPTIAAFHTQPENISYNIGMGNFEFLNQFIYHLFFRIFYRRFSHIHCPSQFIAGQLERHNYGAKLHVISNGVDEDFRPQKTERPEKYQNKFVILMIGRLASEKRQDLIINAVKKSKYESRIQLVFCGRGPKHKKYIRMSRGLTNPPEFYFLSQRDLVSLCNNCDLYVHASDIEIEGISCMEAFSCGLVPVISNSKKSATNQFALDEKSLFEAGSANSLTAKIDYWVEHPEEKKALGARYAQLGDTIRVMSCVKQAEEMYQDAISDYKKHGARKMSRSSKRRTYKTCFPQKKMSRFFIMCLQYLVMPLLYIYNRLAYGLVISGRKNFKAVKGGAVTVMNHTHPMDCTMLAIAMFPRNVYFVSLQRNLDLPIIGRLIKCLGGVALPEDPMGFVGFNREAVNVLKKGGLVHYYPEGMLYPYCRSLRDFHGGAFMAAAKAGVPVIPVTLSFRNPKGLMKFLWKNPFVTISIGKPVFTDSGHQNSYKNLQKTVFSEMSQMIHQAY